jgi:integrase
MTTLRLRYVQAWVDADGRAHQYFRRPGFKRVRLPGLPGSGEFMAAYEAACESRPKPIGVSRSRAGTVAAAVAAYLDSAQHFGLIAPATQKKRRAILQHFRDEYGDKPIALMPAKFIAAMLATKKPHTARNWFKAIRGLCLFCVASDLIEADPTAGMKHPKVKKSDGHHTWDEAEIAQFEAVHAIGTKARLALALGLYTAQRRGDVVHMGRQHIRDGVLHVKQRKTGMELAIPLHSALRAIIEATPGEHLTFLVNRIGKPYGDNDFSEQFRQWCNVAGLPQACVFHGLRKAACRRLAEAGCSTSEIAAISGHATLQEVARYTAAADRARLARSGMSRTEQRLNAECQSLNPKVSKPLI